MSRTASAGTIALSMLVLTGCAGQNAGSVAAPSSGTSASTSPASTRTTTTGDPLATAPVPSPPPSSAFSWPRPTQPAVRSGVAPRGLTVDLATVNRTVAGDVAKAFATIAYSSDTRTDTSPAAAGTRAAPLATLELAKTLTTARPGRGGADWTALVAAQGFTVVQARENSDDGAPAGSATTEYASYVVTITAKPSGTGRTVVVYLQLTRSTPTAPWAVAQLRGAT